MHATPVVDVHSHLYPPFYIDLLKGRTEVPYIKEFPPNNELRLINRTAEMGKPMTPTLYDVAAKIEFMDKHGIDISVLSLGNPWLDFLPSETAGDVAKNMNDQFNFLCMKYPGRLFFFAALPLSAPAPALLAEINRLKTLSHCRGVVLGTNGFGPGLDDQNLVPIFTALGEVSLPVFLHPHYGLPQSVYGDCCSYGQVLPVALGFPMETTIALSRLILSGIFEKVPSLQVIAAHAAGTLPFLVGRLESAIFHFGTKLKGTRQELGLDDKRKTVWDIMRKNIFLDGVVFDKVPLRAAIDVAGVERLMFGTDHPLFFPPDAGGLWPSMTENMKAARTALEDTEEYRLVMGGNAVRELNLGQPGS
ncbi:hypothetical protein BP6252_02839 [Coleophoma cylindrospora]|uniref:Amidohydrolase-related domain-containing protein n=1 Tax=Coleophoma cylindrospora TaxID=1849047 RepID=A0A3D8SFY2_9HELO|nr:hypothetical protein BP6252_02839 [Coleophoma cylindrospora]